MDDAWPSSAQSFLDTTTAFGPLWMMHLSSVSHLSTAKTRIDICKDDSQHAARWANVDCVFALQPSKAWRMEAMQSYQSLSARIQASACFLVGHHSVTSSTRALPSF